MEASCPARASSSPWTAGAISRASFLPSSTPHWSKDVDAPHDALGEGDVLVQRDELAHHRGRQGRGQDRRRRPVTGEDARRDDLLGRALGTHLIGGLAEGERSGLGQVVGQEQLVNIHSPVLGGVSGVGHGDEVGGDELGALVG